MHFHMRMVGSKSKFQTAEEVRKICDDFDDAKIKLKNDRVEVPKPISRGFNRIEQEYLSAASLAPDLMLFTPAFLSELEKLTINRITEGKVIRSGDYAAHTAMAEYGKELRELFRRHYADDISADNETGRHVTTVLARLKFIYYEFSAETVEGIASPWPLLARHSIEELMKDLGSYDVGLSYVHAHLLILLSMLKPTTTGRV